MRYIVSILFTLLILSCAAQGPATGGPKDIVGPQIISVSPIDSSTNIKVNTKIIFEFDEPVDPTSIKSSVSIINFDQFMIKTKRNKVIIQPYLSWPENEVIEINLSRRIRDYQNNNMNRGYQFIFTTGNDIPQSSIIGKLKNYDQNTITQLLLFSWPISDFSYIIKKVEADIEGKFEFLHLKSGKVVIFATEGKSTDPSLAISNNRYGMFQDDYIYVKEGQNINVQIYMDEPIDKKIISSINQINPKFGIINFSDGTFESIQLSDNKNCIINGDSLILSYEAKNRWSQDWVKWINDGILDFIIPMNYTIDEEIFIDNISCDIFKFYYFFLF